MDKICLMHLQYIANGMGYCSQKRYAESVKNMVCRRLLLLKFWDLGIKQLPVMRMEVLQIWRKIILLN